MPWEIELITDGSCNYKTKEGGWCAILLARQGNVKDTEVAYAARMIHESTAIGGLGSGWGWKVAPKPGTDRRQYRVQVLTGGEGGTTNNRMEFTAIIQGISAMKTPCEVTVVTDSQYVIGVATGELVAHTNKDLLREWKSVSSGFDVTFQHVYGHRNNALNNLADELADYKRFL